MQYNKVEICGVNTSKLKVLNEKEKIELLKKAQAGDKQAREELINGTPTNAKPLRGGHINKN